MKDFSLVWTWAEPDAPSGTPQILSEVLSVLGEEAAIVCEEVTPLNARKILNFTPTIYRWSLPKKMWPFTRGWRVREAVRWLTFPVLLAFGVILIRKHRPKRMIVIHKDPVWVLSAHILSQLTRVPLIVWVHDMFLESESDRGTLWRFLALWLEPKVLRKSAVAVLGESMRENLEHKYGVTPTVIRHPTLVSSAKPVRIAHSRIIGFAGMIYENNVSCLKRLADASAKMAGVTVRLFTLMTKEELKLLGFESDTTTVTFVREHASLIDELSQCDVLYLPLSDVGGAGVPTSALRHAMPTKSVDYLLSGATIVVDAPPAYEVSMFFSSTQSAVVCHTKTSDELVEVLERAFTASRDHIFESKRLGVLAHFDRGKNVDALIDLAPKISTGLDASGERPNP